MSDLRTQTHQGHPGRPASGVVAAMLGLMCLVGSCRHALAQTPAVDAFNPGASYYVSPIVVQPDGKVIIGGGFTAVGGVSRVRLARLSPDGAVETGFSPAADATVYALALQPDGKILVGGDFVSLAGQTRRAVGRLNANGTLDTSFYPRPFDPPPFGSIIARGQAILVQPDGKIVAGGRVSYNGGPSGGYVLRMNTNGTSDTTFATGGIGGGPVDCLALQPDGKILVGGLFSSVASQNRYRLARLNTNGSLDTSFNASLDAVGTPIVLSIAVQADDKILVAGAFSSIAGQPRTNLARLNRDGSLDPGFSPAVTGLNASVYCVALQADGKILVGGIFNYIAGAIRNKIGRLHPDGTVDPSYNPGANGDVYGLAVQADGKVLASGFFSILASQPRAYVGRVRGLEPAAQSLSCDGSTVTWRRSGSCCEVWRTTFDVSTDGVAWSSLGDGARTAEGWQLAGVSVPPGARVRARGYATGGGFNSSSWFIESVWPPAAPAIGARDSLFGVRSNRFGFNLGGSIGSTAIVEASADLVDWTPLATNVFASPLFYFSDPDEAGLPQRFYRARLW